MKKIFCLVLVSFFVSPSFAKWSAKWSPDFEEHLKKYPELGPPFTNGNLAAAWSSAQARNATLANLENYLVTVKSAYFQKGKIQILVRPQPGPAPAMVILPGGFGNVTDASVVREIKRFHRLGFHVVALPNPLSDFYLMAGAKAWPTAIEEQARAALDLIRSAKAELGETQVTRVDVFGFSYGGILAFAMMAQEEGFANRVVDGIVTSAGAPTSLAKVITISQSLVEEAKASPECTKFTRFLAFAAQLMSAKSEADITADNKRCTDAIFGHSIRDWMLTSAKAASGFWNSKGREKLYKDWQQNPDAQTFLHVVSPEGVAAPSADQLEMSHWLAKLSDQSLQNLRVITAADDLNNTVQDWAALGRLQSASFVILPFGGHLGYMNSEWYQQALPLLFKTSP